jgi:trk system potassium uptake protein TrkA
VAASPQVVARVHDPHKAEIYRRLGVLTVSPVTLGTQRLAELLTFSQLNVVYSLGSGEVGIIELEAPPLLVGKAVNELTLPGDIRVIAITRGGKTHIPTLGTIFQQGDMVHVAVSSASTDRLKALLGLT